MTPASRPVLRRASPSPARTASFEACTAITEQAVASYVAKYATKAAETPATLDRRVAELADLDRHRVPEHAQRLIRACYDLDAVYPERRLWAWAHMLGFRGHFSTKSRRYSTTLGALRQVRADYRATEQRTALGLDDMEPDTLLVLADWQFAGHGHTPGESVLAASIAEDIHINRETAREALQDQRAQEGSTRMTGRLPDVAHAAERLGTTERFPRRLIEQRRITRGLGGGFSEVSATSRAGSTMTWV